MWAIKDWKKLYERAESRKIEKLSWIAIPIRQDGMGLRRLLRRPDGVEIFGCFILMAELSARQPPTRRGQLADGPGAPLTVPDVSDSIGVSQEIVERSLQVLCSAEIGWMEEIESTDSPRLAPTAPDSPQLPLTAPDATPTDKRTGEERRVHNKTLQDTHTTAPLTLVRPATEVRVLTDCQADTEAASKQARWMDFWNRYPLSKRVKEQLTQQTYFSLINDILLHSQLMEGLERWHRSDEWNRGIICGSDNFLSQKRWKEHPAPVKTDTPKRMVTGSPEFVAETLRLMNERMAKKAS